MIELVNGYVATCDDYGWCLRKRTGNIDKKTGKEKLACVSYQSDLQGVLRALNKQLSLDKFKGARIGLDEAVQMMRQNNEIVQDLIDRIDEAERVAE